MTCYCDPTGWGPLCTNCAAIEFYNFVYEIPTVEVCIEEFTPDEYYHYIRLRNVRVIALDDVFTTINHDGLTLKIPNKIIKYNKKNHFYVHKNIYNDIVSKYYPK